MTKQLFQYTLSWKLIIFAPCLHYHRETVLNEELSDLLIIAQLKGNI